jgi:hypothetical protein
MRRLILWVVLVGIGIASLPGCSKEAGVTSSESPIEKRLKAGGLPPPPK